METTTNMTQRLERTRGELYRTRNRVRMGYTTLENARETLSEKRRIVRALELRLFRRAQRRNRGERE